jgi:stage V sporulation protein B
MVEQIVFLPTVITIGLTTSLIPNIAKAYSNNNVKKIDDNYQDIMRVISYMGIPLVFIFAKYSSEICHLLFGYGEAGKLLLGLAFSAPFIYYLQVSSGMLNGLGKPMLAVRNMLTGSITKLIIIYFLTGNPAWGITGTTAGITTGFVISAILNYLSIAKRISYTFNLKSIMLKPLISIMVIYFCSPYLNIITNYLPFSEIYRLKIIYLLSLTGILYLGLMFLFKAITVKDINRFKF